MTPQQRSAETQLLLMHMNDYWYEVDMKGGAGVSARFVEDGIFEGGGQPLVGRAAIEAFYGWRQARGTRTSRHVITNFRAEFSDARHATTHCVMMLYAADGAPVLPSTPPINSATPRPITVTMGTAALRNAWRNSTFRSDCPLARAVRM